MYANSSCDGEESLSSGPPNFDGVSLFRVMAVLPDQNALSLSPKASTTSSG